MVIRNYSDLFSVHDGSLLNLSERNGGLILGCLLAYLCGVRDYDGTRWPVVGWAGRVR